MRTFGFIAGSLSFGFGLVVLWAFVHAIEIQDREGIVALGTPMGLLIGLGLGLLGIGLAEHLRLQDRCYVEKRDSVQSSWYLNQ